MKSKAASRSEAEKQRRYRERRSALARSRPDVVEAALLQDVERCERGELSDEERIALADKLADLAVRHQGRAIALSKMAQKVRYGRVISDPTRLP
jgi:hypothetical protein